MGKAAFFDIDGTLIDVPNGVMKPGEKTVQALKAFQAEGNEIFLATARGKSPFEDIDFDGFIGHDGHYIVCHDDVMLDDLFSDAEIRKMDACFEQCGGRAMYSGHEESWCACYDDPYVQKHAMMFRHTTEKPEGLHEIYVLDEIQAAACCVLFESVGDLKRCYAMLKDDFTMVLYETGLIRMDVYRKGFTKGTAVEYVFEKLGYERENVYAFGDGVNDMEMLEKAGHGIAMANGVESLKKIAETIADSVSDEGVAGYFLQYMQ
ncbi:MAG: HAD hydrolase family protein [Bulleidia sp.]